MLFRSHALRNRPRRPQAIARSGRSRRRRARSPRSPALLPAPSRGPVEDNGRPQTPTRLDGIAAEARRPEHSRDHRFPMSPLVRLPERPKFSPGMKMLQKSMPLPAGPGAKTGPLPTCSGRHGLMLPRHGACAAQRDVPAPWRAIGIATIARCPRATAAPLETTPGEGEGQPAFCRGLRCSPVSHAG